MIKVINKKVENLFDFVKNNNFTITQNFSGTYIAQCNVSVRQGEGFSPLEALNSLLASINGTKARFDRMFLTREEFNRLLGNDNEQ